MWEILLAVGSSLVLGFFIGVCLMCVIIKGHDAEMRYPEIEREGE